MCISCHLDSDSVSQPQRQGYGRQFRDDSGLVGDGMAPYGQCDALFKKTR